MTASDPGKREGTCLHYRRGTGLFTVVYQAESWVQLWGSFILNVRIEFFLYSQGLTGSEAHLQKKTFLLVGRGWCLIHTRIYQFYTCQELMIVRM